MGDAATPGVPEIGIAAGCPVSDAFGRLVPGARASSIVFTLKPLGEEDVKELIRRLKIEITFTDKAISKIIEKSAGNVREIISYISRVMAYAREQNTKTVDESLIELFPLARYFEAKSVQAGI